MFVVVQIHTRGRWQRAATIDFREPEKGYRGATYFQYDDEYALTCLDATDARAVSGRFAVSFELHRLSHWPAFALDLLPSGNARREMLDRLQLRDGPTADVTLLQNAQFAPGNLRIQPAAEPQRAEHPGFGLEDILTRKDTFIEYARERGASVAGSSGAQGDAPKFLLVQDKKKRWHSEGALSDDAVAKHWIVKFPRGKTERDRLVLRNEAAYMRVAKEVGLRVAELPRFQDDTLFVPRFDRIVRKSGVFHCGLESLCSLSGEAEFGGRLPLERLCADLARHSSTAKADVVELIKRDILNVMLGNTDNHARNSAVLKTPGVALSPLYDFAPMSLDPEGIPRLCRWTDAESDGLPDWCKVVTIASRATAIAEKDLIRPLIAFRTKLAPFARILKRCRVDPEVVEIMQRRIATVLEGLNAL